MHTYKELLLKLEAIIDSKCNLTFSLELEDLMELDRKLRKFYFGTTDQTIIDDNE